FLNFLGAVLACIFALGPITIGGVGFGLYWLLFGVTCATLGYSSIQIGVLARVMHGFGPKSLERLRTILSYNRGMLLSAGSVLVGIVLLSTLVYRYLNSEFRLFEISHPAIFGLLLV